MALTIGEFRRLYGISARVWRDMADSRDVPMIRRGERGRSFILEADAEAWASEKLAQWLCEDKPEMNDAAE